MTNNNIYLPKDTTVKTEEIKYLENQEPKKQATEKDFFIGCPNEDDTKNTLEGVMGGILAAGSVIPNPLQPVAIATSATLEAEGRIVEKASNFVDDEDTKKGIKNYGEFHKEIGGIGGITNVVKNIGSGFKKAAENTAENS